MHAIGQGRSIRTNAPTIQQVILEIDHTHKKKNATKANFLQFQSISLSSYNKAQAQELMYKE